MAEQERLQQLSPTQAGWGAAQRRLRAIAPEIARLLALAASPSTEPDSTAPATVSGLVESDEQHGLLRETRLVRRIRDQAAPAESSPALNPRSQRLMQLQHELAQLKRTPSMQLLARQRIPKLEAEMKQLISDLQESA